MSGRGNGRALGGRERRGKKKEESEGKTELKLNPFSTPRHSAAPLPPPCTHPLIVRVSGPPLTFNKRL